MNPDHGELFRELDPPPGGAERFRQRLAAPVDSSRAPRGWLLAASVTAAALVIVAVVALQQPDVAEPEVAEVFTAREFDRLLGRPMERLETTVVINDAPVELIEVPGATPGIRIYEIRTN